jgi:Polyketide cyclase / dehydrase and lipid transport
MASQIEHAVTIERPATTVYEYFLDLDRNASDPGVQSASKIPPGPTGPGTEFHFSYAKGPDTMMRFTGLEPNRRIGFVGRVGPLAPAGDFVFEPLDGSTRLTVRVDPRPAMLLRPLSPLIRRKGRQVWEARFARVKAALEAPTPRRDPAKGATA